MDNIILTKKEEALKLLDLIDPSSLDYENWLNVGMALESVGLQASDWDTWSQSDNRYEKGECNRKWKSFRGSGKGVSISTLAMIAKEQGHNVNFGTGEYFDKVNDDEDLDMNGEIGGGSSKGEHQIIDQNWIRETPVPPCSENWKPNSDLINFLLTLFRQGEYVAYTMESFSPEDSPDKFLPKTGIFGHTREDMIDILRSSNDPLSPYNPEAGAWIRVNPFDGCGVNDSNVKDFRYALIESDEISIEKQYTILKELELPIATLVHSGGKSLHALVKIDAPTYEEYRKRVDFLYSICRKNSFSIDKQNRNPSRLSRMPGITRKGKPQYLIDTNMGKENWEEWKEWIEDINDDLPEMESLADTWDNPPELAPELIYGLLRVGHKMLVAGPSKAGKSWSLIQLCIAIAEGGVWNGFKCAQGKVLYVNLELDRPSCLNRFKVVYDKFQITNPNISNIDIWNLRGKSAPMDKLAPKLIRRALKKRYSAIIIDPIYKVITGDENSADQMAHFCNQFDKVCTELKASVICCHHHSKGTQGDKKSADRSSGSGVFSRDPDALIDLLPLTINEPTKEMIENEVICSSIKEYMRTVDPNWENTLTGDEQLVANFMRMNAETALGGDSAKLPTIINQAIQRAECISAWRIEGTLREFPSFKPRNMFFNYPVHRPDTKGMLDDALAEGSQPAWKKQTEEEKEAKEKDKKEKKDKETDDRNKLISNEFRACQESGEVITSATLAELIGVSDKTLRRYIKNHPTLTIEKSIVKEKA